MAEHDWSRDEVEATVAGYFDMLHHELAGARVNKSEHNERLRDVLQRRSKGSVEFKHANISAVLTLHGYPYRPADRLVPDGPSCPVRLRRARRGESRPGQAR